MSALIDTLLPQWDFREVHGTDVAAPPERTWEAVEQVTVGELPLTRLLVRVRGLGRLTAAKHRRLLDEVRFLVPLAEAPGDRVLGLVGRPWKPNGQLVPVAGADDFAAFDRPGWVRAAIDFRVAPARGGTRLETETRIAATDAGARRRFTWYWRVVRPGSALIRRDILRAIRRRAEEA
jgi:hypothetical protein